MANKYKLDKKQLKIKQLLEEYNSTQYLLKNLTQENPQTIISINNRLSFLNNEINKLAY
jgi:hypothetical protein